MEELTAKEKVTLKEREMKEKYADVINDLLVKYGGTVDKGFEYLKGLARALLFNEEPLYTTDIEFNKEELIADEKEFLLLSEQSIYN